MTIIDEIQETLQTHYTIERLQELLGRLKEYDCSPENEYEKKHYEDYLQECIDKLRAGQDCVKQLQKLQKFVKTFFSDSKVNVDYEEPYGNSCGVIITVGQFVMEMTYKTPDEDKWNKVRTRFHLLVNGSYKDFVVRPSALIPALGLIGRPHGEYYNAKCIAQNYLSPNHR